MSRLGLAVLLACVGLPALADDFDQLDGPTLELMVKESGAARERLTVGDLGGMPALLRGSRSALIVATTDQGNPCRMLVTPGLRKAPGGKGEPVPVIALERFETFEAGNLGHRLARGKDLLLFDGFRVDLDSGQVVPEGQGGDLLAKGEAGKPAAFGIVPIEGSKLFAPTTLPAKPAEATPGRPSAGRVVKPSDFAGRYRLFANGQWSGALELAVDPKGVVNGRFRSDQTGNSYKVVGQVESSPTNRVRFAVEYPRAAQEFDGHLFVESKGAIAGTVSLLDRPFGFFALREGGTFVPDGEDVGLPAGPANRPGRVEVTVKGPDAYEVGGQAVNEEGLAEALKPAAAPDGSLLLRVGGAVPFEAVSRIIEAARAAGVVEIRLGPPNPAP